MGNIFDNLQRNTLKTVHGIMGETATWTPSEGGALQSAVVLFNDPTRKYELDEVEFMPRRPYMEFKWEDFTTLKAAVENGLTEVVEINGTTYIVQSVENNYDGRTNKAHLTPAP